MFNTKLPAFPDLESIKAVLQLCKEEGIKEIDTAKMYGDSEEMFRAVSSGKDFIISTKVPGEWEVVLVMKEILSMTLRVPCKGLKWTRSVHHIFMDLIRTPLRQRLMVA